ncbi:methyltransferase [Pseudomarimonas salicorniae]|uniref:Class I SAM-dependent methyltransferase n=1 Tax=Pseudomarimonas salicorniae TaxID=2933270 RepID=A0ABT0GJV5_9GAMM|nr:class I SAM-dependent methyltransferase [Lysobacter sp. CAU 1642]
MAKQYDRDYYDRWYRGAVGAERRAHTARKAAVAVATCEYYLGRPLRSVLDIGCGEGHWRAPLLKLRPKLDYLGLDGSEYAVSRYGRSRNLRLVRFGQLESLRFDRSVDLIVCSDVLHYLPATEIKRGLSGFPELAHGMAFIDLFCRGDDAEGDHEGFFARSALFYARQFAAIGLRPVGTHCYLLPAYQQSIARLEQSGLG